MFGQFEIEAEEGVPKRVDVRNGLLPDESAHGRIAHNVLQTGYLTAHSNGYISENQLHFRTK